MLTSPTVCGACFISILFLRRYLYNAAIIPDTAFSYVVLPIAAHPDGPGRQRSLFQHIQRSGRDSRSGRRRRRCQYLVPRLCRHVRRLFWRLTDSLPAPWCRQNRRYPRVYFTKSLCCSHYDFSRPRSGTTVSRPLSPHHGARTGGLYDCPRIPDCTGLGHPAHLPCGHAALYYRRPWQDPCVYGHSVSQSGHYGSTVPPVCIRRAGHSSHGRGRDRICHHHSGLDYTGCIPGVVFPVRAVPFLWPVASFCFSGLAHHLGTIAHRHPHVRRYFL